LYWYSGEKKYIFYLALSTELNERKRKKKKKKRRKRKMRERDVYAN